MSKPMNEKQKRYNMGVASSGVREAIKHLDIACREMKGISIIMNETPLICAYMDEFQKALRCMDVASNMAVDLSYSVERCIREDKENG